MTSSRVSSFIAGVLVANSAPHLATAVTGRQHLTPLAGRNSGPAVNAVWGGINLVGGLTLLARSHCDGRPHWGDDLVTFEVGCLALAAWMAGTERVFRQNSTP